MGFKSQAANITETSGQAFDSQNSVIQWLNGKRQFSPLGNTAVPYTGGFILLFDKIIGDSRKMGWQTQTVTVGSKEQPALVAPRWYFAVIAARSRWETQKDNTGKESTTKRIQILAVPYNCQDAVIITIAGHGQLGMQDALRQFQSKVLNPAGQQAGLPYAFPSYAFWLDVATSAHKMVGKDVNRQSEVTVPAIQLPELNGDPTLIEQYLEKMYVGDENYKRFAHMYEQSKLWAAQWNDQNKAVEKGDDGEEKVETPAPVPAQPQQQQFAQSEFAAAYAAQAPIPPPVPAIASGPAASVAPAPAAPSTAPQPVYPAAVPAPPQAQTAAMPPMPQAAPSPQIAPALQVGGIQVLPPNWASQPSIATAPVGDTEAATPGFQPPF